MQTKFQLFLLFLLLGNGLLLSQPTTVPTNPCMDLRLFVVDVTYSENTATASIAVQLRSIDGQAHPTDHLAAGFGSNLMLSSNTISYDLVWNVPPEYDNMFSIGGPNNDFENVAFVSANFDENGAGIITCGDTDPNVWYTWVTAVIQFNIVPGETGSLFWRYDESGMSIGEPVYDSSGNVTGYYETMNNLLGSPVSFPLYDTEPERKQPVTLDIQNNGGDHQEMQFGIHDLATNGLDESLGETDLPPLPPSSVFDARFRLPQPHDDHSSLLDLRPDGFMISAPDKIEWQLDFQAGNGGYPVTVTWDQQFPAIASIKDDPFWKLTIHDPFDLSVADMTRTNQFEVDNNNINRLIIELEHNPDFADTPDGVNIFCPPGWILIGLPITTTMNEVSEIFSEAEPNSCYEFNQGYEPVDMLEPGKGYWLKFSESASRLNTLYGSPLDEITLSLQQGWNLVSGPTQDVANYEIADPDQIIVPNTLYQFMEGYKNSLVIAPGRGYWIKASQAGQITLLPQPQLLKTAARTLECAQDNFRLSVQDERGSKVDLYLGRDKTAHHTADPHLGEFELPPPPVSGLLDARLILPETQIPSHRDYRPAETTYAEYTLVYQWPHNCKKLILEWEMPKGYHMTLCDPFDGTIVDETFTGGKHKFVLDQQHLSKLLIRVDYTKPLQNNDNHLPDDFDLGRNYPNPFNPQTTIPFTLSTDTHVKLKLFNSLGRKVAVLIDQQMSSGHHETTFTASDLPSGIYHVQLEAQGIVKNRKILLLK